MASTGTDRIEKRIELTAPVARGWRALTDPREFGTWFRVNLEGPFAPGKPTRGHITHPGYEHLVMEVVVQTMEPPHAGRVHAGEDAHGNAADPDGVGL